MYMKHGFGACMQKISPAYVLKMARLFLYSSRMSFCIDFVTFVCV